jgi:hypothetical protein
MSGSAPELETPAAFAPRAAEPEAAAPAGGHARRGPAPAEERAGGSLETRSPGNGPEAAAAGRGSRRHSQWAAASVEEPGAGDGHDESSAEPPEGPGTRASRRRLVALASGGALVAAAGLVALITSTRPDNGPHAQYAAAHTTGTASASMQPLGTASFAVLNSASQSASSSGSAPPGYVRGSQSHVAAPVSGPASSAPVAGPASSAAVAGPAGGPGGARAAGGPVPVGWWKLDGGLNATAADVEGADPATVSNAVWCWNLQCLDFNAPNASAATARSVLDTAPGQSFTVTAMVWLSVYSSTTSFETMVSQDGDVNGTSGFFLQFLGDNGGDSWAFSRPGGRAVADVKAQPTTWTYLAGVYDASDNLLSIYVDGALAGTQTLNDSAHATRGSLVMGRAQVNGHGTDWFNGYLANVQVYQSALNANQINSIPAYQGHER